MQDVSTTANGIEDMQQSRSNYSPQRSMSELSKASSIRHSMEAPLESPSSKYEPALHSTDARDTPVVDSHTPPTYDDDSKSEIRTGSGIVRRMSKREYAMEISKMMGKQLVRSVNGEKTVRE